MNLRRGLTRFWIVASLCWIGGVVYVQGEKLCPAWGWRSPTEIAQKRAEHEDKIAKSRKELTELIPGSRGYETSTKVLDMIISINASLLRGVNDGTAGYACFTNWNDESAQRTGGWSPDWPNRWTSVPLLFGPPLALLLAGLVLRWIVRGFRSRA